MIERGELGADGQLFEVRAAAHYQGNFVLGETPLRKEKEMAESRTVLLDNGFNVWFL